MMNNYNCSCPKDTRKLVHEFCSNCGGLPRESMKLYLKGKLQQPARDVEGPIEWKTGNFKDKHILAEPLIFKIVKKKETYISPFTGKEV